MPCRDPSDELYIGSPRYNEYDRKIKTLEAMLCAVLTAACDKFSKTLYLDQVLIEHIDERESGVSSKELKDWWKNHQEKDRARRRREQAEEQKRQVKAAALAKLTPEERKALGL